MAFVPRYSLSIAAILFAMAVFAVGCSSVQHTSTTAGKEEKEGAVLPYYQDEYAELDDASSSSSTGDRLLTGKLEAARQKYLRALTFIDRGDTSSAARAFEEAINVLNTLVSYPRIEDNPDFADLMQSILEDYESYIQSIDHLDENSSIAILRDKFFEEVDAYSSGDSKNSVSLIKVPTTGGGSGPVSTAIQGELQIPLTDNEYVQNCLKFSTSEKGQKFFTRCLQRAGRWFPLMRKIAREEGVPEEIIYLSIIESGLDPNAISSAKAVGLWQFIKTTGEMYDLNVNYWVDERRDPEKATRAAMRHLKDLYDEFGNWHLALAAYNCGMGGVRRTIARSGKTKPDYWEIRDYLPRETRGYVPIYIAAAKIFMNPTEHGFTDIAFEEPYTYETVTVSESVDLVVAARCAGSTEEELRKLNPELVQGCIPPNTQNYTLKLPVGTKDVFAYNFANLADSEKRSWVFHKVKRGETLTEIAEEYGTSVALIADANNLSGRKKRLRTGTSLRIPLGGGASEENEAVAAETKSNEKAPRQQTATASTSPAPASTPTGDKKILHQVRRNETLHSIANRYGVRITDLRNWNDIPYDSDHIQLNTSLVVYLGKDNTTSVAAADKEEPVKRQTPSIVNHKVRRGETVATIADDYGVTIADIRKHNRLNRRGTIKIGQTLRVPAGDKTSAVAAVSQQPRGKTMVTHKVRRGETLSGIASLYGVEERDIARWNPGDIRGNTVYYGSRLKIYSDNIAKGSSSASHEGRAPKTYKIRRGDTLGTIAGKFGVSVARLKKLNRNIDERSLQIGDTIRLQ